MKEPHKEGVANHSGLEPCVVTREGRGETSVQVRAGQVLNREMLRVWEADAVKTSGRQYRGRRERETLMKRTWCHQLFLKHTIKECI